MIVFSVAFGAEYIDKLFDRCIPSLFRSTAFARNHVPEPMHLRIFTTSRWKSRIESKFQSDPYLIWDFFDTIEIRDYDGKDEVGDKGVARTLLQSAVLDCLKEDQSFIHAVPDLVYGPRAVQRAYDLHKSTGKVVSLFNGRVKRDVLTKEVLHHTQTTENMIKYFLKNCDALWDSHMTYDPKILRGSTPGHMILITKHKPLIFCSVPNPFMGKFVAEDRWVLSHGMGKWDHEWVDQLVTNNRMIVQTDLHNGFSIEPSPKTFKPDRLKIKEGTLAELQEYKFKGGNTYCFTG